MMNTKFEFPEWMGEIPRQNALWCDKEDEVLKRGFKINRTLKDIAAKHGRHTSGIINRLRKLFPDHVLYGLQKGRLESQGIYFKDELPASSIGYISILFQAEILTAEEFTQNFPDRAFKTINNPHMKQVVKVSVYDSQYRIKERLMEFDKEMRTQKEVVQHLNKDITSVGVKLRAHGEDIDRVTSNLDRLSTNVDAQTARLDAQTHTLYQIKENLDTLLKESDY
jgi:hypothetical protein